VGGWPAPAPT